METALREFHEETAMIFEDYTPFINEQLRKNEPKLDISPSGKNVYIYIIEFPVDCQENIQYFINKKATFDDSHYHEKSILRWFTLDEIRKALATTTKFKNDFIWKNIPMLDLPSAIRALQAGEFSKVKISGTVETVDATKQELAEVLAGAKLLNIEMARMTKKIKDLEDLQVGSESKLSEANLALLALQNESKANLELIAKLQSDLKSGNELIANLEAASKATTITCVKGKLSKKVSAINPKCPTGYKKKV
jgi:hypothetical protein